MKNLFVCFAIMGLFFVNNAFAQDGVARKGETKVLEIDASAFATKHSAEDHATLYTTKLDNALALSGSQEKQIYAINVKTAKKETALRATRANNVNAFRTAMKTVQADRRAAIARILTPTQSAKMVAMNNRMKAERNVIGDVK